MRKQYLTGFFSGIGISAMVLICLTLSGCFRSFSGDNISQDGNGIKVEQSANANTISLSEDQMAIMNKLTLLEKIVDKNFLEEVDKDALATGIYKGYIASLGDPYSVYYTEKEYKALLESSSGTYCGIGAIVSQNVTTGILTIVKPFVDGPAYTVGMLPGDILYKIEDEEVTGEDISDVVSRMKGEEGTEVKLSVVREGESEPLEFIIKRAFINVPTIEYKMLEDNLGYIIVSEFDQVTVSQFKKALKDLKAEGMKGLIIDLRNNPGGLLDSVVKMLEQVLDGDLIVYTEDKYGKRGEWKDTKAASLSVPLCVLINEQSASASEIFAGAVQDYGIGTLVGTTTFGKGIVQSVRGLSDGTAVKLTISKYYTPKGRNIHGTGIQPDVEVKLDEELKKKVVISMEEDNQLKEAIRVLKEKIEP